ncbi:MULTISPECIES: adenylate/guanylate cyclase domain-containing protein [Mycolicibacter]|uniref:Adenylate/guanylate cyclase domain-containing protein n=1 Tax=[Mycobacterium] vasticus TaxID=2875777 RepID=A0ABU5Z1W5_9MYCO|nr:MULTISPECIES: adenylate/guanylate cyclase domain-containing protein [unclassified Mycolicibacter]MEB3063580.1 adenylate/guanylate cyclase domain-containing protein [Mycolicibacter sp. MYC101]MEB3071086.1 adenylate/guanylate cyclase domain-containing protein [Mycolicibacter sp. MYC017]
MVDWEALEAAGIADARDRAGLVEYLDGLGFTAEDMADAERQGRLFGLAGDAVGRSGPPIHTLRTAAEALGIPLVEVERAWTMLGLSVADPDTAVLSQADVDGLATWAEMRSFLGEPVDGFLRVLGATMARLAEAESSMIRLTEPNVWLGHTQSELRTARAWRSVAAYIPRIGAMIDAVHRQHQVSHRTFLEGLAGGASASIVCGVGFADLTGFTALTQVLTAAELANLLTEFGGSVADVVHADGGRVVKFIGDAVMWVSSTPQLLAKAAADLVDHPKAQAAGLQVRAGLAYGEVLAINGDYFGTPVNLAARLVDAAAPNQILASTGLCGGLSEWQTIVQEPLTLKGFDEPVAAYELRRSAHR